MGYILCPPSIHEYTIEYNGKKFFGEHKRISLTKQKYGITSPIMHYPYLCGEDNCEFRFMFYSDLTYHLNFHHNIYDRKVKMKEFNFHSHLYSTEKRKEDGFFTMNELMTFTNDDFKKYNALQNRKKRSSFCSEKPNLSKKIKIAPSMDKIESLLQEFTFTNKSSQDDDQQNLHVLANLQNEVSTVSQNNIICNDNDTKHAEENDDNKKDIIMIDLTNISDDSTSKLSDLNVNDNNKIKDSIKEKNCLNSLLASVNKVPPNLSVNTLKDFLNCGQNNLLQKYLELNNKENQKEKPKSMEILKVTNSKISTTGNTIVNNSISSKVSPSNLDRFKLELKSPKYSRDIGGSRKHGMKISKNKNNGRKNEKEIIKNIKKILLENKPKQNGYVKNIDDNNTFEKEKNTKQLNKEIILLQKDCQSQLLSTTSTNSTNIATQMDSTSNEKLSKSSSKMKGIYYCIFNKECNFITKYRINYEKHITEHGVVRAFYRCSVCSLVFQTENVFIEHKTKFCLKTFGELRPKMNCQTSYHQEFISLVNYYDLLICRYSEVCSFVCNTKEELRYHIQELHENEEELYRCLCCDDVTFKNKVNLAIHSRNYCWKTMELQISDGNLLECRVDNCTFSSYSVPEWHIHLVSHSYRGTRTPYECDKCHIFLSTKIAQMEHEQYFCLLLKKNVFEKKE